MYKEKSDLIKELKKYKNHLSNHQFKTFKGKIIAGDFMSVRKGLVTVLKRKGINISLGRW